MVSHSSKLRKAQSMLPEIFGTSIRGTLLHSLPAWRTVLLKNMLFISTLRGIEPLLPEANAIRVHLPRRSDTVTYHI